MALLIGQPSNWTTTPSHQTLGASGSLKKDQDVGDDKNSGI